MRRVIALMLLATPVVAVADHFDVIQFKLNDGCSLATELQIMRDFNTQWGDKNGYKAEIAVPIQSDDLVAMFWVGRTKDTAIFGKAWDTWLNDLADPNSAASKLWARFLVCGTNLQRHGYDVY